MLQLEAARRGWHGQIADVFSMMLSKEVITREGVIVDLVFSGSA